MISPSGPLKYKLKYFQTMIRFAPPLKLQLPPSSLSTVKSPSSLSAAKGLHNLYAVKPSPNLCAIKTPPNIRAVKTPPNIRAVKTPPNVNAIKSPTELSAPFSLQSFKPPPNLLAANPPPKSRAKRKPRYVKSPLTAPATGSPKPKRAKSFSIAQDDKFPLKASPSNPCLTGKEAAKIMPQKGPIKPSSPFLMFIRSERPKVSREMKNVPREVMDREIHRRWMKIDGKERAKLEAKYKSSCETYEIKLKLHQEKRKHESKKSDDVTRLASKSSLTQSSQSKTETTRKESKSKFILK